MPRERLLLVAGGSEEGVLRFGFGDEAAEEEDAVVVVFVDVDDGVATTEDRRALRRGPDVWSEDLKMKSFS